MENLGHALSFSSMSQKDSGIIETARYGMRLAEWTSEVQEGEPELATRIDVFKQGPVPQVLELSPQDIVVLLGAIRRNLDYWKREEGHLVEIEHIVTDRNLPELEEFVA